MTNAAQLTLGVDALEVDPLAEHRATIRAAIAETAAANLDHVSPNAVRRRLARHDVPPRLVGQVYRALRREGRLVPAGTEVSDDHAGGNGGKIHRCYRWVNP